MPSFLSKILVEAIVATALCLNLDSSLSVRISVHHLASSHCTISRQESFLDEDIILLWMRFGSHHTSGWYSPARCQRGGVCGMIRMQHEIFISPLSSGLSKEC